ncbi:SET domain-containing protein [Thozetella sp. PMI_491]|nr:SET domain-containing protein [Thozetella sp. PMI_491]
MKAVLFLALYTAATTAHRAKYGSDTGLCPREPFATLFSGTSPLSSPAFQAQQATKLEDKIPSQHTSNSDKNTTLSDVPSGHNWTFSSPCVHSTTLNDKICVFSDAKFASGKGISILTTPSRARFIASQHALSKPDSIQRIVDRTRSTTTPAKYEMKKFPKRGMGLEATRFIRRGELIMADTASLMIDYRSADWLSSEDYESLNAYGVGYLPEAARKTFMNLSTHADATGLTKTQIIRKIISTNSFEINPEFEDKEQAQFLAIFPEISRMNHDCRPSAKYYFNYETMTHYVHAMRDIFPGEELSLSYINPSMSRRERRKRLKESWGFSCECRSCTQDDIQGAVSDDRIAKINSLLPEFLSYEPTSQATPKMAELLISLYQQEKMWGAIYIGYIYAALEYSGIGDAWTATKYAHLALEYGIPAVSIESNDIFEMAKLASDPWNHWSWMKRTNNQVSFGGIPH